MSFIQNIDLVTVKPLFREIALENLGEEVFNIAEPVFQVILEACEEIAEAATDEVRRRRMASSISENSAVFFRADPEINWGNYPELISKMQTELEKNAGRNPNNQQFLVYTSHYQIKYLCIHSAGRPQSSIDVSIALEELRNDELLQYLKKSDAIYHHRQQAHFDLPSERVSDYFLRVGNVQSLSGFHQACFFWLVPLMSDVGHIHCDSWSISSLAAFIVQALRSYDPMREVMWSSAHEYLANSLAEQDILGNLLQENAVRSENVLVLNSFFSTGRLRNACYQAAERCGCWNFYFKSIFADTRTTSLNDAYLCDIKDQLETYGLKGTSDVPIPITRVLFPINARTYFPDYRKPDVQKFSIKKHGFDKSFFERYAGKNIFSVSKKGDTPGYTGTDRFNTNRRHHAFHIDANRLISTDEFVDVLKSRLKNASDASEKVSRTRTALISGTEASLAMVNAFERALGVEFKKIWADDARLTAIAENQSLLDALNQPNNDVLICLPMIISGSTLGNLQVDLRTIRRSHHLKSGVVIAVGLLRPNTQQKINELKGLYLKRNEDSDGHWVEPFVIEETILPNWQENRCPWVIERSVHLEEISVGGSDAHLRLLVEREELLSRGTKSGLVGSEVFFTDQKARLQFNPESLFLDSGRIANHGKDVQFLGRSTFDDASSEADLCCAVASAIQCWRLSAEASSWHFTTIDAATLVNHNGFNEARLRAAIWRSLTREERSSAIRGSAGKSDFESLMRAIFLGASDTNQYSLRREARLAFGRDIDRALAGSS